MATHFFVNFDVFKSLYLIKLPSLINTKLRDFVNLGVLFLSLLIIVAYPIIYRLVPSSSRSEIRQSKLERIFTSGEFDLPQSE